MYTEETGDPFQRSLPVLLDLRLRFPEGLSGACRENLSMMMPSGVVNITLVNALEEFEWTSFNADAHPPLWEE